MIVSPKALEKQHAFKLHRKRPCIQPLKKNMISMEGKIYLNFSSNDYLGLSQDERLAQALCEATKTYGVGATASRIICGHHPLHQALEEAFAEWMGYESALLFSNGYMANLGVIEALSRTGASFCLDKFCHASLMMGIQLCDNKSYRYQHADLKSLHQQLQAHKNFTRPYVVTEGLFSMEGDITNLASLYEVATAYQAPLVVDDAHGIGVLGDTGRGILEHHGLGASQVPLLILPLGKAFGTYGAMVLSDTYYRELILQFASTYTYTTNIPPALCAASLKSLDLIREESWRRKKLQDNIAYFQTMAKNLGLSLPRLQGPIQIIPVSHHEQALFVQDSLRSQGFYVHAVRAPTVPHNQPRIRLTLNSLHELKDIEQLLQILSRALFHE